METFTLLGESPASFFWFETPCSSLDIFLSFRFVQPPIENDDPLSDHEYDTNRDPDGYQNKTATKSVKGFLVSEKEVWGEPVRGSTESVGNSDQGGLLVSGTWDQLSFPGDLNVETGEDTHDQETHSSVSHSDIEGGDQHDGTDS